MKKISGEALAGASGTQISRRNVLAAAASIASAAVAAPFIIRNARAAEVLRISNFGGFFEKAFVQHVYPEFTKATGIEIQSLPQATSAQFITQLGQAIAAGDAPMDICASANVEMIRGRDQGLWTTIDASRFKNLSNILPGYNFTNDEGVYGVGAMGWFATMIVDPAEFDPIPDSWTVMWEPRPSSWGFHGGSATTLFEIVAATFFGGTEILDATEGIDKVIAKMGELKPNAKLWWTNEGSMQSAYQNGEIVGGVYLHDVAGIMKKEGTDVVSVFPKEGAVQGFNSWCVPKVAEVTDATVAFLDWSATPTYHELIARHVGCAPLIARSQLDLTDEEFASVASEAKPILIASEAKVKYADYMATELLKMLNS